MTLGGSLTRLILSWTILQIVGYEASAVQSQFIVTPFPTLGPQAYFSIGQGHQSIGKI